MIKAFYTAGTGARGFQYALDNIANNLANVNTHGYKSKRVNFYDLLYDNLENGQVSIGTGSAVSVHTDYSRGAMTTDIYGTNRRLTELSNVDIIREMTDMIMAQRAFQMNANMIKTADEIEQYANNLLS
jgi:flagellar basal-body rod protein FlgB